MVTSYDGLLYLETGVHGARIPYRLQIKEGDRRTMDQVLRDWVSYAIRNDYTHMVITEADFGIEGAPDQLAVIDGFAAKVAELTPVYRSDSVVCYRFRAQSTPSSLGRKLRLEGIEVRMRVHNVDAFDALQPVHSGVGQGCS